MYERNYYVYFLTNAGNSVLYIGVTNDLLRRLFEHKELAAKSFSARYKLHKLVYFESTDDINAAITREKQLKKWRRPWKEELIETLNPTWRDLGEELG